VRGPDTFLKKCPVGSVLLPAGSQHHPYPGRPVPAHQRTSTLGDLAISHHGADNLFSRIIGGFYFFLRMEEA